MGQWLPLVANWQNGVRDTYSFNTSIFETEDGSEQRRAKIIRPRRRIEMAANVVGLRGRMFWDAVEQAHDGLFSAPDHAGEQAYLSAGAGEGSSLLRVVGRPDWLRSATYAALLVSRIAYLIRVDVVSGLNITLAQGIPVDAPNGAVLLPVVEASLGEVSLAMLTTDVATTSIALSVLPGSVQREPLPLEEISPVTLAGRYILTRKPNYISAPTMGVSFPSTTIDYGRGVTRTYSPIRRAKRVMTASYYGRTRTQVAELLDIFLRARGRAGEIYVPTWCSDFPKPLANSGGDLLFAGSQMFEIYGESITHKAVLIDTESGLLPREIVSVTMEEGNTRIEFNANVGSSVSQINRISWMFVCRFAQDELAIQWVTDTKAEITLSFATLENLPVEGGSGSNWILDTSFWRDEGEWEDVNVWRD